MLKLKIFQKLLDYDWIWIGSSIHYEKWIWIFNHIFVMDLDWIDKKKKFDWATACWSVSRVVGMGWRGIKGIKLFSGLCFVHFTSTKSSIPTFAWPLKKKSFSNYSPTLITVITNSSGPAIFVRYNRVNLYTKITNLNKKSVRYNQVFVISEFVITEFHCIVVLCWAVTIEEKIRNSYQLILNVFLIQFWL